MDADLTRTTASSVGATAAPEALEARLLAIVRDLVVELHPHLRRARVTLDSDLDRDLGLDSLGRTELMHRLERAFKVRLPDRLLADAATPRDLLQAVAVAGPDTEAVARAVQPEAKSAEAVAEPAAARTLIDALAAHVRDHGSRPHIHLWQGEYDERTITYADLDDAARRVARGLVDRGLQAGDRVAIMLPAEPGFFAAFFGVLHAGGVPVPIYPPFRRAQIEDHLRRQAGILRNAGATILITNAEIRLIGDLLYGLAGDLRHVETVERLGGGEPLAEPMPAGPDTMALIQYTSGSTGDPKGVVLTHANLLANIRAMGEALEATSADTFVSWLPLYHDMGLIGAWLSCLYYGVPTVIMTPLAFLADPGRWLRTMHRHRATLSAAPNFAYELCLKTIRDEDIAGLDLSSLRFVCNGAEPVSPSTISRFTERFAAYGFRPGALAPVYGLAENAVGLAFPPVGRLPIVDRVDRLALSTKGFATPAVASDPNALEFVACGLPLPRHEVRIVDTSGREVPERTEGRLQFRGPSATGGYFRNEEKTRALFDDAWLESGDRAYIAAGDIYITGRIKDMIIKAGRNLYPHEIEELIGGIEGVRKGCVVAFASTDARSGTERLVLIAETRLGEPSEQEALRRRIIEAASTHLQVAPDEVVLAPPHTVPKTSSGKIRRSAARALYDSGALSHKSRTLWWQLVRLGVSGVGLRLRRYASALAASGNAVRWWSALVLVALPMWLLVLLVPGRRRRSAIVHRAARAFLRLAGMQLEITGNPEIPAERVMLIANHASYLDSPVMAAAIPGPLAFVAKAELSGQLVAGPFLRGIGTLFVRRADVKGGVEDTARMLEAARKGERIVSFPEGTLTRVPGLMDFRLGSFLVAAEAGIPVIPVAIRGTRSILRDQQWFPHRGAIRVHIGVPVHPDGTDFAAAVRLRDAVRAAILSVVGEPDLARERVEMPGAPQPDAARR